jgi:mono/diheme cytochrome c family protein
MKLQTLAAGLCLLMTACNQNPEAATPVAEPATVPEPAVSSVHVTGASQIEIGAYLADLGGCHDCHTPGWAQTGGNVPEDQFLVGTDVGFSGPWGTSYPGNLRLTVGELDAGAWADMMKDRNGLPPMPWPMVNRMSREDLMALHAYITSLGPAGEPVPMAVTDGSGPRTPFIWFVPQPPEAWPAQP